MADEEMVILSVWLSLLAVVFSSVVGTADWCP
jgi:hypothetical protein